MELRAPCLTSVTPVMPSNPSWRLLGAACILLAISSRYCSAETPLRVDRDLSPVRFNRDVRPILSDKCFACHGPDAKHVEGDLRLDLATEARAEGAAIVPGDAEASRLVERIMSEDENEVMPPVDAHKPLTAEEKEILRRWIDDGAVYEAHWAYTPLRRPEVPQQVSEKKTAEPSNPSDLPYTNEIDRFVARRLAEEGLTQSSPADRVTLIRRVSLDLTGIPPTPEEVDAFVNDTSTSAYAALVDRLLDSPRFGERMAIYWLDLVRYADTVGYHGDQDVSQSPYRDYVIKAFNSNMPYDQFVREQLAGDLLPDATQSQLIASGYNRLNQTTEEGGAQAKEYLAIYFADRVRNVSQVFMGATVGCAQCHDHKFDPYTARDFYSLGAFFADLEERGVYGARERPPVIRVLDEAQRHQLAKHDQRLAELNTELNTLREQLLHAQPAWEQAALKEIEEVDEVETVWIDDAQNTGGNSSEAWEFVDAEVGKVFSGTRARRQRSEGLVQHVVTDATKTITISANTRFFTWVYLDPENPPTAVMLQFNDGSWEHRAVWGSDDIVYGKRAESWPGYFRMGGLPKSNGWVRLQADAADMGLGPGSVVAGQAWTQFGGLVYWDKTGSTDSNRMPEAIAESLKIAAKERSELQSKALADYCLASSEAVVALTQKIADEQARRRAMEESALTVMVSKSVSPRTIRVLPRGNWMDDSGEIVAPAIPAFLGSLATGDRVATRLDLANWLCQSDHPLTSRTFVNRLWYLMFGRGICASVDDLGGQGTYPSYPDLLDWLAVELIDSGWDIKDLLRTIVSSATYRQSSKPSPELRADDPYNQWFARQGRFRIDAEMVRDGALSAGGLLVEKVGGESVKPYQPDGYYAQLNFPTRTYVADVGDEQFRRGVYTHWQRTFLHPMLKAFDAPSREECTAARSRSNTPLQALTLLNDPSFVEAARALAARIMREGGQTPESQIVWAYRTVVSHQPEPAIIHELHDLFDHHHAHYRENPDDAKQLVNAGIAPSDPNLDTAELAAWTSVARTLLNLHETITRY